MVWRPPPLPRNGLAIAIVGDFCVGAAIGMVESGSPRGFRGLSERCMCWWWGGAGPACDFRAVAALDGLALRIAMAVLRLFPLSRWVFLMLPCVLLICYGKTCCSFVAPPVLAASPRHLIPLLVVFSSSIPPPPLALFSPRPPAARLGLRQGEAMFSKAVGAERTAKLRSRGEHCW